ASFPPALWSAKSTRVSLRTTVRSASRTTLSSACAVAAPRTSRAPIHHRRLAAPTPPLPRGGRGCGAGRASGPRLQHREAPADAPPLGRRGVRQLTAAAEQLP